MCSPGSIASLLAVAFFGGVTGTGFAQPSGTLPAASPGTPVEATARIAAAAQALVTTLDEPGRSGPTSNGSVAYFRIQGPTLVIEYAPQGNVDHIHTIYRDPTNDYGAKFTRK